MAIARLEAYSKSWLSDTKRGGFKEEENEEEEGSQVSNTTWGQNEGKSG